MFSYCTKTLYWFLGLYCCLVWGVQVLCIMELLHTFLYLGLRIRCRYSMDFPEVLSTTALTSYFVTLRRVLYRSRFGGGEVMSPTGAWVCCDAISVASLGMRCGPVEGVIWCNTLVGGVWILLEVFCTLGGCEGFCRCCNLWRNIFDNFPMPVTWCLVP